LRPPFRNTQTPQMALEPTHPANAGGAPANRVRKAFRPSSIRQKRLTAAGAMRMTTVIDVCRPGHFRRIRSPRARFALPFTNPHRRRRLVTLRSMGGNIIAISIRNRMDSMRRSISAPTIAAFWWPSRPGPASFGSSTPSRASSAWAKGSVPAAGYPTRLWIARSRRCVSAPPRSRPRTSAACG
jgi:hypothetical protein